MDFEALAANFPATAALLCGLFYADYALTVVGQRLYMARGREVQEHQVYELNPLWRDAIAQSRFWTPRLWLAFAVVLLLAGLLWILGWYSGFLAEAWQTTRLVWVADIALSLRDTFFAIVISRSLFLIAAHLRNIVLYSRYLTPEYVSGKSTFNAAYSFGVSRVNALTAAIPFIVLAAFEPSPLTVGFALGPLVLAMNLRRMEQLHRKQSPPPATPDTTEA